MTCASVAVAAQRRSAFRPTAHSGSTRQKRIAVVLPRRPLPSAHALLMATRLGYCQRYVAALDACPGSD